MENGGLALPACGVCGEEGKDVGSWQADLLPLQLGMFGRPQWSRQREQGGEFSPQPGSGSLPSRQRG